LPRRVIVETSMMTLEQARRRTMLQQDNASARARSEIAWALREWNIALAEAQQSAETESYAYAFDLIVAFLDDSQTVADLLGAYYTPTAELGYLEAVRDSRSKR
jgi:hypothetical protein